MENHTSANNNTPYKPLGRHLKYLREQLQESVLEVSGAVEIDAEDLSRIEQGVDRPSEDILLLLIQHYDMQDHEAVRLWELAGYDSDNSPHKAKIEEAIGGAMGNRHVVMLLATDSRAMYSDGVDIAINQAGLTLHFTQTAGPNQQITAGKVGMSYDQAKMLLQTLDKALQQADYLSRPKGLPAPDSKKS